MRERAKVVINNLKMENKQLQQETKDMKQCRHCEEIDELNEFQNELKGGHDEFSLLKMICIVVLLVPIIFFAIVYS